MGNEEQPESIGNFDLSEHPHTWSEARIRSIIRDEIIRSNIVSEDGMRVGLARRGEIGEQPESTEQSVRLWTHSCGKIKRSLPDRIPVCPQCGTLQP